MKKAVIVGTSFWKDSFLLKNPDSDCLYVACDGGYRYFLDNGIEPDILVGDFDTLDQKLIQSPKITIKLNPIKDDTDSFYIVKTLLDQGYQEFHFYGCYGGKLDHTLANIQILSYLKDKQAKGYLYSEDNSQVLFMLDSNEYVTFRKEAKGKLSVFSYSPICEGVCESNLKYTLENATLDYSVALGISNEFINTDSRPVIRLKSGRLLLIVPSDSIENIK